MEEKCVYCGQGPCDGGYGNSGFICIDCIALNPDANAELHTMAPLQSGCWSDIQYPPECYDVERYKMEQNKKENK